jgi:hypothetical protein
VDAINRADIDTGLVLDVDTGFGDDVGHAAYSSGATGFGSRPSLFIPE